MKRYFFSFALSLILAAHGIGFGQNGQEKDYDILIRNGRVFDGSGSPAFRADVAVRDGIIVGVAGGIQGSAKRVIDARGRHVSPGFIDLHTHVDEGMYFRENRACENYLHQGVTSVVVGQCGGSAWPIFEKAEDQMHRWSEEGIGPNAALLVGHGTVRGLVMGMEDREPTEEELEEMKALVREAMEQGAHGLSTGLVYEPSRFGETDEIIALVEEIVPYGGIYHSHIRGERDELLDSVGELIEISEKTGAPAHISHFKVIGAGNWGLADQACSMIEEARGRGLRITADQYPYRFANNYPYRRLIPNAAWSGEEEVEQLTREDVEDLFDHLRDRDLIDLYAKTTPYTPISDRHRQYLDALPRKSLVRLVANTMFSIGDFRGPENTRDRMRFLARMEDPEQTETIKEQVREAIERSGGPGQYLIAVCVEEELKGKTLAEASEIKGMPFHEMAIALDLTGTLCIPLLMCEADIETIMKKDYVGTGSDGTASSFGIGMPHIRSYSTFLHKIKKYGMERKTVTIPHIIRSQTSLPAAIMEWEDRGWIKEGYRADIVVLDLENIETRTSVMNPHRYCRGVDYLLINGELAIERGEYTGALPGEVIKLKK